MSSEEPYRPDETSVANLTELLAAAPQLSWPREREALPAPRTFRVAFGQEPIHLGPIEFRILLFLASRPYYPFTRRAIAAGITTDAFPITEAAVDEYVAALRDQLGVLHDYVQSVPYIGYRFKA